MGLKAATLLKALKLKHTSAPNTDNPSKPLTPIGPPYAPIEEIMLIWVIRGLDPLQAQVYIGTNPHRNLTGPIKEGNEYQTRQPEKHSPLHR